VILTYLARRSGKYLPQGEDEELEALRWIIFDNQKVNGFLGPYRFLKNFAKPPGDPAVLAFFKGRMREENAVFGGEVTGHYYFRDNFYCDNGFIPAMLILELMSKKNQSLKHLLEPLPIRDIGLRESDEEEHRRRGEREHEPCCLQ